MKRIERHHLKDNELATTLAGSEPRGRGTPAPAALRSGGLAGDRWSWRWASAHGGSGSSPRAGTARGGDGGAERQGGAGGAAGPEGDAPAAAQIGATGSFSTEEAKLNAAIPKLQAAADAAPSSAAGLTARYHLAGALAAVGRHADAITAFEDVSRRAGADQLLRADGADGEGRRAGARRPVRRRDHRLEGTDGAAGRRPAGRCAADGDGPRLPGEGRCRRGQEDADARSSISTRTRLTRRRRAPSSTRSAARSRPLHVAEAEEVSAWRRRAARPATGCATTTLVLFHTGM